MSKEILDNIKPLDTLVVRGESYLFIHTADYEYYKTKAKKYDIIVEEHHDLTRRVSLLEEQCVRKIEAIKKHVMRVKYEPNHFPLSYDGKFLMIDYEWVNPTSYWEELLKILGILERSEFTTKDEDEK